MFAFALFVTALLALSLSVLPTQANGVESLDFSLSVTVDDFDAGKITGADKRIIEDAVVTSFNNVHDTDAIMLESFNLYSISSTILSGYLEEVASVVETTAESEVQVCPGKVCFLDLYVVN
jgi:hypothetical protein